MKVAAILVGGFGTRLQPVVKDVPKPLAPINGKPFLFFLLESLAAEKYTDVVLLTGYMHDKIATACGNGQAFNLNIHYSQESEPLGTAGALKLAEKILNQTPDFLLLNGDSFCPQAISALSSVENFSGMGLIAVSYVNDASRFGTVLFDADTQKITRFQEKQLHDSGYVNAGVYKLSPKIFEVIPANKKLSLEQDIFPAIIQKTSNNLAVCIIEKSFDDIGLPETYQSFIEKSHEENSHES